MIKQVLIIFVALISLNITAQEGTASPYSFYGIGELKFRGTAENRAMGGISMYADSIHLNLQNPASLGKLKLTTFAVGGNQKFTTLKASGESAQGSNTSLDYLAIGLPMGKLSMSFGLIPYTSVGYKTGFVDPHTAQAGEQRYEGSGGINKVFLAAGYSITDDLSVGVDFNYNFGKIENLAYLKTGVEYDTGEYNESKLSGLAINFGLSYNKMLNEKLQLISGLTYSPAMNLTSENFRQTSTVSWNSSGLPVIRVVRDEDLAALGLKETNFKLPSKLAIGAGIGQPKKWFTGVDVTMLSTSDLINRTFNPENVRFENSTQVALGGFYIPKFNSLTNYWQRVVYRAGFRYENTGLIVDNEKINEFGISFGAGLPVGRIFSNVNLGVEYGSRGTTSANLVQENFFNINIGLSFNDKWFQRRKID